MCRAASEGGRRCNHNNSYGRQIRNLQAKKQYHARKGHQSKVEAVTTQMEKLRERKNELISDGGTLLPFNMELTPNAKKVLNQLRQDGYFPYIVGGSVRDALMGAPSKDVDIEVYKATPEEVVASLRKIGQVDEVGKSFGVLKIRIGKEDFDVSLPRKDSKTGDGHRGFTVEVTPELSLTEATARRDFTVNALMYDDELGYIIDKHGGLEDMKNGYLHHVSDAFDEDPLRVLRGVQMASRFNMKLHPDTVQKAKTLKGEYKHLAVERVQIEFQKMWEKGKAPHKAVQLLQDTEWAENFPGLTNVNMTKLKRNLKRTQQLVDNGTIPAGKKQLILSATIATELNDKDATTFLTTTSVGDDLQRTAYNLSRLQLPVKQGNAALRAWARAMPRNLTIHDWVLLQKSQGNHEVADRIEKKAKKLNILNTYEADLLNGDEVLNLFPERKPGRWVKEILDAARNAQYSEVFRTKEKAVNWLQKNKHLF